MPNGSSQRIGISSAARAGEQRALGRTADLADEAHAVAVEMRRDLALEERPLARLDDARQHERHARRAGGGDRAVRPLVAVIRPTHSR